MVRSEHVRTLFDFFSISKSKSEVSAQLYMAMHIKTHFNNALYLSSLLITAVSTNPVGPTPRYDMTRSAVSSFNGDRKAS